VIFPMAWQLAYLNVIMKYSSRTRYFCDQSVNPWYLAI